MDNDSKVEKKEIKDTSLKTCVANKIVAVSVVISILALVIGAVGLSLACAAMAKNNEMDNLRKEFDAFLRENDYTHEELLESYENYHKNGVDFVDEDPDADDVDDIDDEGAPAENEKEV